MSGTGRHTTNYTDTFIEVADDTKAVAGQVPPAKAVPTVAQLQHALLSTAPYAYTSDDLLFEVYARRQGLADGDREAARRAFFSKGQACLRSSPLGKTYGWGTHHDAKGRVALYAVGSADYERLSSDPSVKHVRAMRSSRAS